MGRDLSMKQKLRQNPQIKLLLRLFLSLPGLFLEAGAVPAPHGAAGKHPRAKKGEEEEESWEEGVSVAWARGCPVGRGELEIQG